MRAFQFLKAGNPVRFLLLKGTLMVEGKLEQPGPIYFRNAKEYLIPDGSIDHMIDKLYLPFNRVFVLCVTYPRC